MEQNTQHHHRPSIAVCLAAYNGMHYLPEQIASILGQVDVSVTVFVSVDPSSDGTEAWFDTLALKDERIVLLPFGEKFGGAARNFFRLLRDVDFSVFDYAALADQDDIWLPNKLKRAVDQIHMSGVDGYSSDVIAFWESGRSRYVKKSYPQRKSDYFFESAGPGCTFVMTKRLAIDVQGCIHSHSMEVIKVGLHDWFIYAYARAHGYQWTIDEYAGMYYRQHGTNQVGVNNGWAALAWRMRKILDGWGMQQAKLIADLVGKGTDPFVHCWSARGRLGVLWLALQANHCRRRPRDRVWFALSCISVAVMGRTR
jgi:rhamnosyltransferase